MKDQCALFGHPVAHSRSPRIYRAFSEQTGQRCGFRLIDCTLDRFPHELAAFADVTGVMGANVTTPLKLKACELSNALTARAELAGAVNVLRFETRGWILGDNVDGEGLVRDLVANIGLELTAMRVLVVGAGGAARGILGPLLEHGAASVVIVNRDPAKADAVAGRFARFGRVASAPLATPGGPFDLVINATSASLSGEVPGVPPSVFAGGAVAYDLAYRDDGVTPFTRWAAEHGSAAVHDGWGMLVEQAAESWDFWFGSRPDTAPLRDGAFRLAVAGPPGGD